MFENHLLILGLLLFVIMTLNKTIFPCVYFNQHGHINIGFNKPYNTLEVHAAIRLEQQYVCTCQKPRKHFPQIVRIYHDWFGKRVVYTACGFSLKHCGKQVTNIPDHEDQLRCIFNNFVRSKLLHLDLLPKNICIKNDNTICVIDFDIVWFLDNTNPPLETKKQKNFIKKHSRTKANLFPNIEYNYIHNRPQHLWNADFTRDFMESDIGSKGPHNFKCVDICFICVYQLSNFKMKKTTDIKIKSI